MLFMVFSTLLILISGHDFVSGRSILIHSNALKSHDTNPAIVVVFFFFVSCVDLALVKIKTQCCSFKKRPCDYRVLGMRLKNVSCLEFTET